MVTSERDYAKEHEKDKKLMAALDANTNIPHLLIELRSLGTIEICGKDIGGIYKRLENWMAATWNCEFMDTELKRVPDMTCFNGSSINFGLRFGGFKTVRDTLRDHDRLCDASFDWKSDAPSRSCLQICGSKPPITVFKQRGDDGENNMGKLTMELINFMTNTCGWGLKLCNGTNLGFYGQIREQQVKFKAPHPLNLVAPHLMIELRQAGYIEINGPNTNGIIDKLGEWLASTWNAKQVKADPAFCDIKVRCTAFKKRGTEGENNMGLRTMELVDFMVATCAWTMITCNGGNYGRYGDIREQQMVFRNDEHVQHGEEHIMVELRDIGYIEVNGLSSSPSIEPYMDRFMKECWQCKEYDKAGFFEKDKHCDRKYVTPHSFYCKDGLTNNIGKLTIELAMALASQGWMLMLCNGGRTSSLKTPMNVTVGNPNLGWGNLEALGHIKREQQIKFTKARHGDNADEPLLMIELRSVPKDHPEIKPSYGCASAERAREVNNANTRIWRDWIARGEYQGLIEVNGPNVNGIYQKLEQFIKIYMRGYAVGVTSYCDCLFHCDIFRQKLAPQCNEYWDGYYSGENNFGKYTMRLCDFLVDHIREWDLIVCNGNATERAWQFNGLTSLVAREQQLIFRHRPIGKAVFMASSVLEAPLGRPPQDAPTYWKDASRDGSAPHEAIAATSEELQWMQELLDGTHIRKVTRDRKGGSLADRFKVVAAVRSEHAVLWDAFAQRRNTIADRMRATGFDASALVTPRTVAACPSLAQRCLDSSGKSPSNEAYLMHGTNPTSAVAILRTDFKIDLAGASAGTMFGPGAYLAEASSKADEYAQAETDGAYKGLYAILVCRALVGRSHVVEKRGDYSSRVVSGEFDSILGDREKAAGTFREFIFFHEESIFPEYAVFYRRESATALDSETPIVDHVSPSATALYKDTVEAEHAEPPIKTYPGIVPGEYQVVVPTFCTAGSRFQVNLPGIVKEVVVSEGMRPGSIITVNVDD